MAGTKSIKDKESYYIRINGNLCFECNSKNIAYITDGQFNEDGTVQRDVECHDCGSIWIELYTLVNVVTN